MGLRRIDIPDIPYHVFARGNNKELIFFDERDRMVYLKILREAKRKFSFLLYSYALMDNHFHLLLQMLGSSKLSQLMHQVQLFYVAHINRKYGRVGHLFQGRYQSNLVETDRYFLTVDRYIHLNPVRAGMVSRPEDFSWSSYNARRHGFDSDWIDHASVLHYFGNSAETQIKEYVDFTNAGIGKPEEWSHETLSKTVYLGSAEFIQKIRT